MQIQCNKDCKKCKQLNVRTDAKGYPFGYDCLKYNNSVFQSDFENTKEFKVEEKEMATMQNKSYKEREKELHTEYTKFLATEKGQEWKKFWKNTMKSDDAGDFGDYLYDFYPEMLM